MTPGHQSSWPRQRAMVGLASLALLAALTGLVVLGRAGAGPLVRTVVLDQFPLDIVVDPRLQRAFITVGSPHDSRPGMRVLDTGAGTILHTFATRGGAPFALAAPYALALDTRAARVFLTYPQVSVSRSSARVSMLDARTGDLVRAVTVGLAPQPQGLAVDEQTDRAFVANIGRGGVGLVTMLDTRSGQLLHTTDVGMEPHGALVVDQRAGRLLVPVSQGMSGHYGHVSILDARRGVLLHTVLVDSPSTWAAVDTRRGHAFVGSGQRMYMFDTRSGVLLRRVRVGTHPQPPVVDEQTGRLFVVDDHAAHVLDTASGRVLRTVRVGGYPGPLIDDARRGHVFVVCTNTTRSGSVVGVSNISMLDARSGALLQTVVGGLDPRAVAVDERHGRVFVLNEESPAPPGVLIPIGSVSVLDTGSGTILRTIPVGAGAHSMTVDERTGHVFVLNEASIIVQSDPWGWMPHWLRRWAPFLPSPGSYTRTVPGSVSILDATQ